MATKWIDCGERPFETKQQAQDFAIAEVGAPHRIVFTLTGWHIEIKEERQPWLDTSRRMPERIELWVQHEFPQHPAKHAAIVDDLIDAASEGPTTGYQRMALAFIFPELQR